jgi:hypothetical protein
LNISIIENDARHFQISSSPYLFNYISLLATVKRHFGLEIEREREIAKCSKRCEGKLRELLKLKERQRMSKKQLTC